MSTHKLELTLDDDLDNSVVVAIHCSEPDYRMAYKINQQLNLKLLREKQDLEFVYAEGLKCIGQLLLKFAAIMSKLHKSICHIILHNKQEAKFPLSSP